MKNPERVAELIAELRTLSETDFERHRLDVLERDFADPPTVVTQIDETHQKFNGVVYSKISDGYYVRGRKKIHRDVWQFFNGIIPKGYVIHHIDGNPENNSIENLQCLSKKAHIELHNGETDCFRQQRTRRFVCCVCGQEYEALDNGNNKYCSADCRLKSFSMPHTITKQCAFCGATFTTTDPKTKFCSISCSASYQFKDHREERICPVCGKTFDVKKSSRQKTCSKTCAATLHWQRRRKKNQ